MPLKNLSISKLLIYLVLIFGAFVMLLPFFWMVSSSLKEDAELFSLPLRWFPSQLDTENYWSMIDITNFGQLFRNTLFITLADVVGQIIFCSMAGYVFARLNFPGKKPLFVGLLITMMMPFEVLVLPIFLFARGFPLAGGNDIFGSGGSGILNTYSGLIFPNLVSVYGVFLFRQFFLGFPKELEDAAYIDGCSRWRFFFSILIPNSMPVIGTMGLFAFMWTWNDFLWPLVVVKDDALNTIQVGLSSGLITEIYILWAELMAGSTLATIPVLIMFLLLQRFLVQGFVSSGLKG